jgi:hypothetical protein
MYQFNHFIYVASTYGSGDYNSCTYNGSNTACNTSASSGLLADTGFIVLAVVTVAVIIIFAALLVRFFKKPKKTAGPTAPHS